MRPKNQRKEVLINIMKKLLALLLCIMLLLPATSALAVNEELSGKVVIYTSMYQFVIDMMDEAMTKEFPNLDVEFFYGGTGSLQQKLAGEIETGKLGCDMMLVAEPAYSLELKEGGWLHPYVIKDAENLLRFPYDKGGMVETLHDNAQVKKVEYTEAGIEVETVLDPILYGRLAQYIVKEC